MDRLLTLKGYFLELWTRVIQYSPMGYLKAFWKKKKQVDSKTVSYRVKKAATKNNPYPKLLRVLGLHFNLLGEQNSPRIFKDNLIQMGWNIHILWFWSISEKL